MSDRPTPQTDRTVQFHHNLKMLPDFLQQQMLGVDLEEVWKRVEIGVSEDGYPIAKYKENGYVWHITGCKPLEQAKQCFGEMSLDSASTLIVYGSGFGYPLSELYKKLHNNLLVLIFEQNIHIFAAMLHYVNLEPIMNTRKFMFFVGDYEDFAPSYLDFIATQNVLNATVPAVVFTPFSRIFKKQYMQIQHEIFEKLAIRIHTLGNDHYDTLIGFHNNIGNLNEVLENPYLSCLQGQFRDVPAFIVANGPSLDRNMHELKKVQGRGLILCCGSAITPMLRSGIKPDAICVLERTEGPYWRYFHNNDYPDDIALLALTVVDPRIFRSFAGPRIPIFRNSESNSKNMNRLIGDGSGIHGGISVAHLAYEIALYMGASPVVFVGMDLAYGEGGLTHSSRSKYAEAGLKDTVDMIQSAPKLYVEGNDGGKVATNAAWHRYKVIFEQMIAHHRQTPVINATEGGVNIRGTATDKLSNVIGTYCVRPLPCRLDMFIAACKRGVDRTERKKRIPDLIAEHKKYIVIYRALEKLTEWRRSESEKLIVLSERHDATDVEPLLRQGYERNARELVKFLLPHVHVLYFQQVILFGCHLLNELGHIHSVAKLRDALYIQLEMFDRLQVICQSLVRNFRVAIENIGSGGTEAQ